MVTRVWSVKYVLGLVAALAACAPAQAAPGADEGYGIDDPPPAVIIFGEGDIEG